ncbi:MAG: transaldolase, partial [Chloroflexota bacterium]
VSPELARDTEGTVAEAWRLWRRVDRPNLMIKVPATREGLPAITALLARGVNVNVTLIFGLQRYQEVLEAHVRGLQQARECGLELDRIASVASFFVSRVDTLVDRLLELKASALQEQDPALAVELKRLQGK